MLNNEIVLNIELQKNNILNELCKDNLSHFRYYLFIQLRFKNNQLDNEFKKAFAYFYRLRLNQNQRDIYFRLLNDKEMDFEKILNELREVPKQRNEKPIHSFFLSFASKLMHTINNSCFIWDNNVRKIFDINIARDKTKEKLKLNIEAYNSLQERLKKLLVCKEVKPLLNEYREEIKKKYQNIDVQHEKIWAPWDDSLISDVKLLDSILWALYNVIKNKK